MKNLKKKFNKILPVERMYGLNKPLIGLTGGIASGKSSVTFALRNKGYGVIDADELVKKIYQQEDTIQFVHSLAPDVIEGSQINFKKLREHFFKNNGIKRELENHIYLKIPQAFKEELKKYESQSFIFYDIPLLFEKKLENHFDIIATVYAPREVQLKRLQARDNLNETLANKMIDSQIDIETKRQLSDFFINNSGEVKELQFEVENFLSKILEE